MSELLDDSVPSPCIKVCRLDTSASYCTACLRTLEEIAGWAQYSAEQKQAVWARLNRLTPSSKQCERCGAQFPCGSDAQGGGCWCAQLPQVLPLATSGDCLCPACLRQQLQDEYRKRGLPPPF